MRLFPLKLIAENPNYDFIKYKKINYAISISLTLFSILWATVFGFNFGIDFVGGINLEVRSEKKIDLQHVRDILNNLNIGEISIQSFGNENDISIKLGSKEESKLLEFIELIKSTLDSNFPNEFQYRKVDFVGPQVGDRLILVGSFSVLLSFIAIMIYIWIRFEWFFGLGVLVALIHDVILSLGFMSITKLDFNLSTIAAILTIIGYSVNDSVVIYDRIRDNLRKFNNNKSLNDVINISMNQTLSRTVLTVITVVLANISLVLFGGEAILSFSLLCLFGIIIGTYSSIFLSATILSLFINTTKITNQKQNQNQNNNKS